MTPITPLEIYYERCKTLLRNTLRLDCSDWDIDKIINKATDLHVGIIIPFVDLPWEEQRSKIIKAARVFFRLNSSIIPSR